MELMAKVVLYSSEPTVWFRLSKLLYDTNLVAGDHDAERFQWLLPPTDEPMPQESDQATATDCRSARVS